LKVEGAVEDLVRSYNKTTKKSAPAKGAKGEKSKLSPEAIAMQQMMRGIHF
jgi:transposase